MVGSDGHHRCRDAFTPPRACSTHGHGRDHSSGRRTSPRWTSTRSGRVAVLAAGHAHAAADLTAAGRVAQRGHASTRCRRPPGRRRASCFPVSGGRTGPRIGARRFSSSRQRPAQVVEQAPPGSWVNPRRTTTRRARSRVRERVRRHLPAALAHGVGESEDAEALHTVAQGETRTPVARRPGEQLERGRARRSCRARSQPRGSSRARAGAAGSEPDEVVGRPPVECEGRPTQKMRSSEGGHVPPEDQPTPG